MRLEPLLAKLRAEGVTLQAEEGMVRVKPASSLSPEVLEFLKTHKPALLIHLQDYSSLYSQALALMDKYGVLIVDCGSYAFTLDHCDPKRLVEARLTYPWGIISTTDGRKLLKWGQPFGVVLAEGLT